MTKRTMLAFALVAACTPSNDSPRDDRGVEGATPQPPPRPKFENPEKVRYHMHRRVDDLRAIERDLIDGHVDDAKALAFLLTKPEPDAGMAPWAAQTKRYLETARALAAAGGVDDGLRREVQVAQACAECHLQAQSLPSFPPVPATPADGTSVAARMARHQWATERLFEGMVGASEDRWRSGLEVLAATPPPYARLTDAPGLAAALQARAKQALAVRTTESLDERATAYGEMLVTCAACHVTLGKAATQPAR